LNDDQDTLRILGIDETPLNEVGYGLTRFDLVSKVRVKKYFSCDCDGGRYPQGADPHPPFLFAMEGR
jgi:hypothetical protein